MAAPDPTPEPTYQSLYRRYRPQRFAEVLGQEHVTRALRNAVRDQRVAHGYLFSGPRGTGKTSTARILAKALNCTAPDDGEPCGACESCLAITAQTSFAVIELDAASNNGVEAMRDLVSRAALGTTGARKVYIIDEVHMLSTAAANTLLKTLEEPPGHVVFVLATTDAQKVLPTIRSRVQHFEFHLLAAEVLGDLVRTVNVHAGLGLAPDDLERVVQRGAGSARDALSVLDQAAALGGTTEEIPVAAEVLAALAGRDAGRALAVVAAGCAAGREPRRLAEEILGGLRNAFLASRAPALVDLPPAEAERMAEQGRALGPALLVRAMERIGEAHADMREALDPRVSLEVALVRVTAPEADASPGALLERIERLERRLAEAPAPGAPSPSPAAGPGAPAAWPSRATGAGPGAPAARPPAPGATGAGVGAAAPGAGVPGVPAGDRPRSAAAAASAPPPPARPGRRPAPPGAAVPPGTGRPQPGAEPAGPPASGSAPAPGAGGRALGAFRSGAGPAGAAPATPAAPGAGAPPGAGSGRATGAPAPPDADSDGAAPTDGPAGGEARAGPPAPGGEAPAPVPGGDRAATPAGAAPGDDRASAPPATGAGDRDDGPPSRDQLTKAWGDVILGRLSARLRARFSAGRFVAVEDGTAVFSLPNRAHRDQCVPLRSEVEQVLSAHFGRRVSLRLVADLPTVGSPPAAPSDDEEVVSLAELRDAPAVAPTSPADRLKSVFPGAKEVDG